MSFINTFILGDEVNLNPLFWLIVLLAVIVTIKCYFWFKYGMFVQAEKEAKRILESKDNATK